MKFYFKMVAFNGIIGTIATINDKISNKQDFPYQITSLGSFGAILGQFGSFGGLKRPFGTNLGSLGAILGQFGSFGGL